MYTECLDLPQLHGSCMFMHPVTNSAASLTRACMSFCLQPKQLALHTFQSSVYVCVSALCNQHCNQNNHDSPRCALQHQPYTGSSTPGAADNTTAHQCSLSGSIDMLTHQSVHVCAAHGGAGTGGSSASQGTNPNEPGLFDKAAALLPGSNTQVWALSHTHACAVSWGCCTSHCRWR